MLLCLCVPLSAAQADEWHFSDVKRIVAASDIHGDYNAVVATLQASGVLDANIAWSGGESHLVITGDLLDRGPESRRVMDLIMRLESEAARAGGQVHLLLGNHEVMNLIGDLRYVADAEYAAFSADESAEEREHWYQRFWNSQPADTDELTISSEFTAKAPRGFFGHRRAFRHDGIYGKWLLEKPLMIVINDTAFVHGGMPPYVTDHGLVGVNDGLKRGLRKHVATLANLVDANVLSPIDRFREYPSALTSQLDAERLDDELAPSARAVIGLSSSPLHKPFGPLWYRGTASCSELVEGDTLNAALNRVGAKRVVIGHTTTFSRRVQQRLDGRIIRIDTGMLKANYGGSGNALVIEGDRVTVVSQGGETNLAPIVLPRRVGYESKTIDDDTLVSILTNGTIVDSKTDDAAWKLVRIENDETSVFAYFSAQPREKGFNPELAAYRLDRMLGLDMVPVTVRREIDGQQGTLQFVPAVSLSERDRIAGGKGERARCSMEKQRSAMHVYDALIHNADRTPLTMLYSPDNWQLMLVSHGTSFSKEKDRPAYLENVELAVGDEWRRALLMLDNKTLRTNLGDVLTRRRLTALARRRDDLLENSSR